MDACVRRLPSIGGYLRLGAEGDHWARRRTIVLTIAVRMVECGCDGARVKGQQPACCPTVGRSVFQGLRLCPAAQVVMPRPNPTEARLDRPGASLCAAATDKKPCRGNNTLHHFGTESDT